MVERSDLIRWTLDISIYIIILIAWKFVDKEIPKIKRGFVCGDESISLPFKQSTVRGIWLHYYFYGTIVILFTIEFLLEHGKSYKNKLLIVLVRTLRWFKYYFISFICLVIVSSTIKNLYGSKRPFFLDVCKPDAALNCTAGSYVESYTCTNHEVSVYVIFEAERSFPSGHAYSVAFSSFFLMFYIQTRFHEFPSKLLVLFMHFVIILWSSFCCVTRISDNWHHPVDVIGAIILTIPFAFYSCNVLCKNFTRSCGNKTERL